MPHAENLDFLNANSLRNFPIREELSRTDDTGIFIIPDDFIVDLVLSVSSDPTVRAYISQIVNMPDRIEVQFSVYGTHTPIGTFVIAPQSHSRYDTYFLTPSSDFVAATGKLVVAEVQSTLGRPYGIYYFTQDTTEVETRTIIPGVATISRFIFKNADGSSFSVTGDVTIVAQTNTRFRLLNASTVAVDAGDGLGLNQTCADERPCIKTINNIPPDSNGDFTITTSDCAKFSEITASVLKGLNLADSCCKPCLSCNELGDVVQRLMQLETDLVALRTHYNEVALLVQQFGQLSSANCDCG